MKTPVLKWHPKGTKIRWYFGMEKWMSNKLDQSVKFTEAHMIFLYYMYTFIYII